ncbi:MAG: ABC transporter permease [Actinomycetota bacterium]
MLGELIDWFREAEDIPTRLWEHVRLSGLSVLGASVIALPIGLYIGHKQRLEFIAVTTANLGRAIPSFAILSLSLPLSIQFGLGLGFWPTFAALFLLAIPPILTNTYVGVKGVDADTIEASRGMGMTDRQVLTRVRLPLALPLIVAGLRTSSVQVVATATLAALVAGGGLGTYIVFGFRASDDGALLGGALLVALLAFATELCLGYAEKVLGARSAGRSTKWRPGEADLRAVEAGGMGREPRSTGDAALGG